MPQQQQGSLYKKTRAVNGRKVKSACWYGAFTDPDTRKRITKKLYSDKQASRLALDAMIREAEQKTVGLIDRYAEHRQRPIGVHLRDYFDHCENLGQAKKHLHVKEADLNALVEGVGAKRLSGLEPNAVERYLRGLRETGLSARKINAVRASVVAFMNWCVRTRRSPENPLHIVPKLEERTDRRGSAGP